MFAILILDTPSKNFERNQCHSKIWEISFKVWYFQLQTKYFLGEKVVHNCWKLAQLDNPSLNKNLGDSIPKTSLPNIPIIQWLLQFFQFCLGSTCSQMTTCSYLSSFCTINPAIRRMCPITCGDCASGAVTSYITLVPTTTLVSKHWRVNKNSF